MTASMSVLNEAAVFLGAAVVVVPLFKRLGLGSVLGYLSAGVLIGPYGTRLVADPETVLHFAEFGVVLFLFIVGLELQPSRLWNMRRAVFGLGGLQVAATAAGVAAIAHFGFGVPPTAAGIVGVGLALSSTAIALQTLAERNELTAPHGRTTFAILLFQDIAVIPLLALLPLLGPAAEIDHGGPVRSPWIAIAAVLAVIGGLVAASRWVLRPVFRWIASTHSQELFTATTLLVVVGVGLLMESVGLSMALGTFLAGVLLSDSEFRHELEADLEPFKGLLLGLFFIAVGMSVNLVAFMERPLLVVGLVAGLIAAKSAILYLIGRVAGHGPDLAGTISVVASQGGEFAFVLFGTAVTAGVLAAAVSELLIIVIGLSMACSPVALLLYDRLLRPKLAAGKVAQEYDASLKDETPVIIAGFGRVGQVAGRILRAKKIRFTALDASADHVDFIKRFGNKAYYGDASRLDLLRAAQADRAKIFILAIDDVEASMRTAETVMKHFPHLTIFARARNRQHAYRLLDLGIKHVSRETLASSVEMAGDVLQELGLDVTETKRTVDRFREYDEALLLDTFKHRADLDKLQELSKKATQQLEELFERDAAIDRR